MSFEATYLRCEYHVDPLGLGVTEPRLSWVMKSDRDNEKQTAYRMNVARDLESLMAGDLLWDSGRIETDATNQIVCEGPALQSRQRCYWRVKIWDVEGNESEWSVVANWVMGLLEQEEWQSEWVGLDDARWQSRPEGALNLPALPQVRKEFSLAGKIKRATAYVSALGIYDFYLNGARVNENYFAPGWTDYETRIHYWTYDVTGQVQAGDNAVGAILADGWYSGYIGWEEDKRTCAPRLRLQLEVEYDDGSTDSIQTDSTWMAAYGPWLEGEFYHGETYDAQREMPGWDMPGFDASDWKAVNTGATSRAGVMEAYPGEPVMVTGIIKPLSVSKVGEAYVYEMGQNFAGFARLKVSGPAGTKVVLRFAERINTDGSVYTENLRDARCTDTYILKGEGEEVWEPRFTFHGFQYVEITGYPGEPTLDSITGVVINSDTPNASSFECSNPDINKLWQNAHWTQRANFIEVPTDCPQRNERLGWTGDAQVYIRTATAMMDIAAFYTKWLVDLEDGQDEKGRYPDIAPKVTVSQNVAAWADAGIICPWTIWRVYGDTRVIERHFEGMCRFIDNMDRDNPDGLRLNDRGNDYGDWLSIEADSPKDVVAAAYFGYSTALLAEMAEGIGRKPEAEKYQKLAQKIRDAFTNAYVKEDGSVEGDTQSVYLIALHFNLVPENVRPLIVKKLVEDIRARNTHLSTGFVGCSYLNPVLTNECQVELAYELLLQDTFPSWLYPIRQGATSIWERWDGWTHDKGFQNPGMNSFAHYAYGSICEWISTTMAGIDTNGPGFREITIKPTRGPVERVKASYDSINGRIAVDIDWQKGQMAVEIPANCTATVWVPGPDDSALTPHCVGSGRHEFGVN